MILTQLTPLQQRLIVSTVGTLIVWVSIYFALTPAFKPIFTLAIIAMIMTAMNELYRIAEVKGSQPARTLGFVITIVYTTAVAISTQFPIASTLPEITLLGSFLACFLYFFIRTTPPFINLSVTIFSIIYLIIPLSCMIRIVYFFSENGLQDGRWWLLYLISIAKMTDMGGFFIGKKFGKQKLAPYISPKKTWEGALGGFCFAIITSLLMTLLARVLDVSFLLTLWESIWLGACIGVVAQFGDLAESLLKRDGGIKDSSHLPGLGGMLDIVDSLIFAAPLVYVFLKTWYT